MDALMAEYKARAWKSLQDNLRQLDPPMLQPDLDIQSQLDSAYRTGFREGWNKGFLEGGDMGADIGIRLAES